MSSASVVAFVHAKGRSERVPGKNKRRFGDRPLFLHAVEHALCADAIDEVVIDSDDPEILERGAAAGATPLLRPAALATNETTGDDLATWQASSRPRADWVVQVIPTAPFIGPETLSRAIAELRASGRDSLAGVFSEPLYAWNEKGPCYYRDGRIPNSSELAPTVFETTGLYANRCRFVREARRRLNPESCLLFELSRIESVDINSEEDFSFAEALWRGLRS